VHALQAEYAGVGDWARVLKWPGEVSYDFVADNRNRFCAYVL